MFPMTLHSRKISFIGCLLITGFCFWKAAPESLKQQVQLTGQKAEASISTSGHNKKLISTPIEDLRVGMRVVGKNPIRSQTSEIDAPIPEKWRTIHFKIKSPSGKEVKGTILRPLSWLTENDVKVGNVIYLILSDMNIKGNAEIISVCECPAIEAGDGPVITGTFQHLADNIFNIYVENEKTPIGATSEHPFWSNDRQNFIPAKELRVGEELETSLGKSNRVTSIEPRGGEEMVYGLEVAGEHVYHVTSNSLLVHNSSVYSQGNPADDSFNLLLGLGYHVDPTKRHATESLLERFAARLKDPIGKNFWEISTARGINPNLVFRGPKLESQLIVFMKDAKQIKMNLDGLTAGFGPFGKESLETILKLGKKGTLVDQNITRWEFFQVWTNFRDKAQFFYKGKDVTKELKELLD